MSALDRLRETQTEESTGYEALRVTGDLATHLGGTTDRPAISVRPASDNGGIDAMTEVLEALHSVETESPRLSRTTRNVSPAHTFEMQYAAPESDPDGERVVTLQYIPGSDGLAGTFRRQLQNQYPDSQVDEVDPTLLPGSGEGDRYVAGATLTLRRYCLYPIKNVDLPGFRTDPTGSVLEEMVGAQREDIADADVVVQIQFKPAAREWTHGVGGGPSIQTLSYNLQQPDFERAPLPLGRIPVLGRMMRPIRDIGHEVIEHDPSKVDRQVAKLLEAQQGEKGWRLCLRVLAVSDDPEVAVARASKTAGMFRNFYESASEQTFVPEPLSGEALAETVRQAGAREFVDTDLVKAQREVAGLVNIPEADHVTTNKLRWSLSRPGEGVPPGTARFDAEAAGVAGESHAVQQVAMLDHADVESPYWYGFGSRHGVEAGVYPRVLDTHQFVGGGTGVGKTTFLTNFVSQVMRRGHGALVIDPKGMDADEFIREWPADRPEEEFVFVDLSDDYDKQVRFNFLEVPGDAEPGTRAFATAVEALCDDLVAMIAQAGGDDNYWGALMNRVTRTLIRGMARSGRTCTLLDLACCIATEENRAQFAQWMDEERIHFIAETAAQIREKEDSDLEPLKGRLDQWIQNDAIRDLISARESTVSIQEAVESGKVIVVRNAPGSGKTEKRLFATALIRRAWVAVREAETAPPFYTVCDEFDSIVTAESDIHSILSEARAFNFPLTLACQNPSNQLPDRVAKAIANQCETFVSFNPGGVDDARLIATQHSPDVEWEDLTNMSPYKFYMRTRDADDELTHSYKVDAFPPVAEVRREVTGQPGMSDEELAAFKQRAVERYGAAGETPEEQKAASHFYGSAPGAPADGLDVTDAVARAVAQGVYDTACRAGDPEGVVSLGDARNAVVRRVGALSETPDPEDLGEMLADDADLWRRLVQHVPEDVLEVRDRPDEEGPALRAVSPRSTIATVGENQSAGGAGHALLMWDAYAPLTWAGLDLTIQAASGDDADGLATPVPRAEQHAPELVERLTGGRTARLESESTTGSSKAGVTAQHVLQAAAEGRRAIVLARPTVAENVADTLLAEPRFCRSDHPVAGETRFYTSPRDLRIDGSTMTRPGARANAWIRDEETGEILLRDGSGEEHARFADVEAVFSDADAYPGGDQTVKRPVIPEDYLSAGADPRAEILAVPEGSADLADLSVVAEPGVTLAADTIGTADPAGIDVDALDVSANARLFATVLLEALADGAVTSTEAHTLAQQSDESALDVSDRTVRNWLSALVSEGVLTREREHAAAPAEYRLRE